MRDAALDDALRPVSAGALIRLARGELEVDVAPAAGGRVAQIRHRGEEWLVTCEDNAAAIAWGCYPMLPWAGRIRRGRFSFDGRDWIVPPNLGEHAIHGVGFSLPWAVGAQSADHVELSLALPQDSRWPFGGHAQQRIELADNRVRMLLSVTAVQRAMPVVIGWHPWFRKPDAIEFDPRGAYPRDREGIATLPLVPSPPAGTRDDCFINDAPVRIHRRGHDLQLTSDCRHWVIYDVPAHATCVEPQSGPPDAFNLEPTRLEHGETLNAWFVLEWR